MAGRAKSLRWVLLRSFGLLVLFCSLSILAVAAYRAKQTEEALSKRLLEEGAKQAEKDLIQFAQPTRKQVEIAYKRGIAGWLSLESLAAQESGTVHEDLIDRTNDLNQMFIPVMQANPEITSIQFSNDAGACYLILRASGNWTNRMVSKSNWGNQTLWFDVDFNGELAVVKQGQWKESDYDPRVRSWFIGAKTKPEGQVFWTKPYVFFTTKELGITASTRWTDGSGYTNVVMFDVLLKDLSALTQELKPTAGSVVAILSKDGNTIGLPDVPQFSSATAAQKAILKPPSDIGLPVLELAADSTTEIDKAVRFEYESSGWWAYRRNVIVGKDHGVQVLLVIPEDDLLTGMREQQIVVISVAAIAVLASFLVSLIMARGYSRPLEQLAENSRRIAALDFQDAKSTAMPLREFKQLADAQAQSIAALQSFSKYVPLDVVRELVGSGEVAKIGGRLEELTVLFTDIVGFTSVSEQMSPEDLTLHLAEYFEAMIETIQRNGGTVDKMIGDSIVAFWGAPKSDPQHAASAANAVLDCSDKLAELNAIWDKQGKLQLPTRFGFASGPMVVGNVGAQTRLSYTVLGDTVNLASRIEGLNKSYGTQLMAAESTVEQTGDEFVWRRVDRVAVVGKEASVGVFELLGRKEDVSENMLAIKLAYEAALDAYQTGEFGKAKELAEVEVLSSDTAAQWLADKSASYCVAPPKRNWDGVT
ncbi:MAG: hypothetical protein L3J82_10825, partial [Planctomycetes bacterium]|nr:hypothetical protein [Planctomycetota bacterium]